MCTESVIEWCPRGELIMELKYVGGGGDEHNRDWSALSMSGNSQTSTVGGCEAWQLGWHCVRI